MQYLKPALSLEQQADLLLKRGLLADREVLITLLRTVSYYRLSGYLYTFRNPDHSFQLGTTLDIVLRRYTFDRRLRLLMLDAVERVEVALRTRIVEVHCQRYGPFGYADSASLPKLDPERHTKLMLRVKEETARSREAFVKHFMETYGDRHDCLPLWMAIEILPFGAMFTLFTGVEPEIKRALANDYGVPDKVLFSWLGAINVVRNNCAHHGRLWNRELGFKPLLPNSRRHPEWHIPVPIPNNRVFAMLTILKHLLATAAPQSQWPCRLHALLEEYGDVPKSQMGFPEGWLECPIWSNTTSHAS